MSNEIRIDLKSTEFYTYSIQESYQEDNPKKFFTEKQEKQKEQEIFENKNDYPEKYEEELNCPNEYPEDESIFPKENFNTLLVQEGEINYDELYFIKKEANKPLELINQKIDPFPKEKVDYSNELQLNFDFCLQEKSEKSFSLPSSPKMDNNPMPSPNVIHNILCQINPKNESDSFSLGKSSNKEKKLVLKKKRGKRLKRKFNSDNMRTKIKRSFCRALRKKLNKTLKKSGCKNYFDFFPNKFASDINKVRNNLILNMPLKVIFLNRSLYIYEDKDGLAKYKHNSNVVESDEIENNEKLQIILNKTFQQLYEDYINSDEFNVNEINRLERVKKQDDDYIERYKKIAKNLINFFSN